MTFREYSPYRPAFVYKTTNLLNNKIYVGFHMLGNKDNRYLGSGLALKAAINKYGKENFKREIIYEGTAEECLELEEFIVDEDFCSREDTYNISTGGAIMHLSKQSREKQAAARSAAYHRLPDSDKEKIKEHLASFRNTMPDDAKKEMYRKRNEKCNNDPEFIRNQQIHLESVRKLAALAKSTGTWYTPNGVFTNMEPAAKANSISVSSLKNYCLNNSNVNKSNKNWFEKGKTFREIGFWFEPK